MLGQLPSEVVESPASETLKVCLHMVLGNQLWVARLEQGLGPGDLQKSLPTSTPHLKEKKQDCFGIHCICKSVTKDNCSLHLEFFKIL